MFKFNLLMVIVTFIIIYTLGSLCFKAVGENRFEERSAEMMQTVDDPECAGKKARR